jgi:chemotaxis signal transduction protein
MIITKIGNRQIGLIVDTVSEVNEIPKDNIASPPEFNTSEKTEKIFSGIGKVDDSIKLLINASELVTESDLQNTP